MVTIPFLLRLAICSGYATIVTNKEAYENQSFFLQRPMCSGKNDRQAITTPATLALPANAARTVLSCGIDGRHAGIERIDAQMDGWI